ncbi:hypothetical protein HaLaN_20242 [Haematococcus lacustris]|uniref:Uncharacterized protein n=1 Tax=Haematococcus lacustris TaxID=44745 RepID=A0A699ZKD9_HAELA|nr:hypothetical protein HaLaN_20242 [Haematococcus lacustris]
MQPMQPMQPPQDAAKRLSGWRRLPSHALSQLLQAYTLGSQVVTWRRQEVLAEMARQLNIWDPKLLAQIKDDMDLLTNASVLEHLMRGPHHRGIKLLPSEVAVFEQPSNAWLLAMLKELGEEHLQGDGNSPNANATKISTNIKEYTTGTQGGSLTGI